jgi:hypothetical protein
LGFFVPGAGFWCLSPGLNTELVQRALGCEPFAQEERQAYCTAIEGMVHAAKAALVPLQKEVEPLEKEGRRTTAELGRSVTYRRFAVR